MDKKGHLPSVPDSPDFMHVITKGSDRRTTDAIVEP